MSFHVPKHLMLLVFIKHRVISVLPVGSMKVTTCCICAKHAKQPVRTAARRLVVAHAEPGTKEADTGSAAAAEEQGDEMDLVRSPSLGIK